MTAPAPIAERVAARLTQTSDASLAMLLAAPSSVTPEALAAARLEAQLRAELRAVAAEVDEAEARPVHSGMNGVSVTGTAAGCALASQVLTSLFFGGGIAEATAILDDAAGEPVADTLRQRLGSLTVVPTPQGGSR